MKRRASSKNIFADKATLILRRMLREPERQWVVQDFNGPQGVSPGLAQQVLETMARMGYVERVKKGPDSYTLLTDPESLIKAWTDAYKFELNLVHTYYTHDENILKKMKSLRSRWERRWASANLKTLILFWSIANAPRLYTLVQLLHFASLIE